MYGCTFKSITAPISHFQAKYKEMSGGSRLLHSNVQSLYKMYSLKLPSLILGQSLSLSLTHSLYSPTAEHKGSCQLIAHLTPEPRCFHVTYIPDTSLKDILLSGGSLLYPFFISFFLFLLSWTPRGFHVTEDTTRSCIT